MTEKEEINTKISESEMRLVNALQCYDKYGFLPICKYCSKIVPQGSRRPKLFCNRKCYNKWYSKSGQQKKAIKKYFEKHPEAREKNNIRMKKYYKENIQKPLSDYCKVCGNLITDRRKTKWCSLECKKIGKSKYLKKWNEKKKNENKK